MRDLLSNQSFLRSQPVLDGLNALRKGETLSTVTLGELSPDDRTYLEAEDCVRSALYSQLDSKIQTGTSAWVRQLVFCYRDLFTNPRRALEALDELEANCPFHLDLPLRLKFWRAHLNLLLGNIEVGKRELIQIASTVPEGIWKNEMLAIRAMGYYYVGRMREALAAHHDCQNSIKLSPDLFLQTFDCGMAARTALKLCDPGNFEYFSERLDASLQRKDDSRYRLRHTGYRAMIFNQLGENETAEVHWRKGDEHLHSTESAIERGQYLVFRGMSYALINDLSKARRTFELAKHELKLAGSPALYLSELDIAERLACISNPLIRSSNLKQSIIAAESAYAHFLEKATSHVYPLQTMYSESAEFCDAILNGTHMKKSQDCRQSLALSIIENISFMTSFAQELSHFRLIPKFIHKITESDLTDSGLLNAMEEVLRVRPTIVDEQFRLPGAMASLESQHEVKTILDFASALYSLGLKSKELFRARSRLKEATRAKHLLHDVRFFAQELCKKAQGNASALNLSKLSEDLNELIESYLTAMTKGENPSELTMVHFPRMVEELVETTFQITGKNPEIQTRHTLPFLWVSDTLLKRLLLNLIKNGIEAGTGQKPVSISYKTEEFSGRSRLIIYISDNGAGLDPSVLDATLTHDESLQTSKSGGIGLGLRSAIECAKEIGAELSIVPTTRVSGTTFRISIDLPDSQHCSKDPEILVIDDSPAVSSAWEMFGEQERVQVRSVYAQEAVAVLNQLPQGVNWIVVDYDLKLPRCTGADLAPALKALGVKVALSTGFNELELPSEVCAIDWDAILSKDPQYPAANQRKKLSLLPNDLKSLPQPLEDVAHIRHEIKNELTPLRVALKGLSKNHPNDPHVKLLACSVKGIERISKKKEIEKNVAL